MKINCFVIMPFAAEFDDVYAVIKSTVETVAGNSDGRCFRLDESQPAGRITDRLLGELHSATVCIADLTGHKPNVMWELGFAMALGKPAIIVTEEGPELPFDITDMQKIAYKRNQLSKTLGIPLKQSLLDTFALLSQQGQPAVSRDADTVAILLKEVAQLKHMMAEVIGAFKVDESRAPRASELELQVLAGHWLNTESQSNVYCRVINGELVSPYCFGGNNRLTAVYFGWRRTGEYWFARYKWIASSLAGFTFLRMESVEKMRGAWWSADEQAGWPVDQDNGDAIAHPRTDGEAASWIRQSSSSTPQWAEDFFRAVEREGLPRALSRSR